MKIDNMRAPIEEERVKRQNIFYFFSGNSNSKIALFELFQIITIILLWMASVRWRIRIVCMCDL